MATPPDRSDPRARKLERSAARRPPPDGTRVLIGDWPPLTRDPTDPLGLSFLVGSLLALASGELEQALRLALVFAITFVTRRLEPRRPFHPASKVGMALKACGNASAPSRASAPHELVHLVLPAALAVLMHLTAIRPDVLPDLAEETGVGQKLGIALVAFSLGMTLTAQGLGSGGVSAATGACHAADPRRRPSRSAGATRVFSEMMASELDRDGRVGPPVRLPRLGRCPVCRTSVLADDDFVTSDSSLLHTECEHYRRSHMLAQGSEASRLRPTTSLDPPSRISLGSGCPPRLRVWTGAESQCSACEVSRIPSTVASRTPGIEGGA
jgi:hypothetical protein